MRSGSDLGKTRRVIEPNPPSRSRRRHRVGAVALTLAVLAAGCTKDRAGTSRPSASGATGTSYLATVTRTAGGVPHITAADLNSVAFGQGYAQYQDHGCDLPDQVLKINGERSKYLGAGVDDANVASDFSWKTIDVVGRARADWPRTDPELVAGLEAFAAGWSAALEKEPTTEWCAGADWVRPVTGFDIYAYARSVALFASSVQLATFLGSAQPPGASGAAPTTTAESATRAGDGPAEWPGPSRLASNGWAIGSERTADGQAMLLANPHFPWEGALRFNEVHLTVPGRLDVYGAMLSGLPFVAIGFTKEFAWTHTVSAGHRFTVYRLALQPGSPTTYLVDGKPKQMTSRDLSVEVDGETAPRTRTVWATDDGPILDFPGVGWTDTTTLSLRDANIDNTQFLDQYLAMNLATSFDEFVDAHRRHQGVPLFNTIAVAKDGRAWYADTSATPNLSAETVAAWEEARRTDSFTRTAAGNGAVLLDGSTSRDKWVEAAGARSPGLVPFDKMPVTERRDYLFNANDSFWMSNADHVLAGDYSPMHGDQAEAVGMRTRENAAVLRDTGASGPSGPDGRFDLDELTAAALRNGAGSARFHLDAVRDWCKRAASGLRDACDVLSAWDGRFDLDSVGAVLWREYWAARPDSGPGETFDATRPVDTPVPDKDPTLIERSLRQAIDSLGKAGIGITATLRTTQRDGRIADGAGTPVGGGFDSEGVTNVVGYSPRNVTLEPVPDRGTVLNEQTGLVQGGYRVNYGSSFMMAVQFGPSGPTARTVLTYGQTADRTSPLFTSQTRDWADKKWKTVAFDADEVSSQRLGPPLTVRS